MSKELVVGNESFLYAEQNEPAGWGEDNSAWAEAVTNVLGTVSGPNDIATTTDVILNNQSSPISITGLQFSTAVVRGFEVEFVVYRNTDSNTVMESGKMTGTYDGVSDWYFNTERLGDAGVYFQITSGGQVQYYSDDTTGLNYSGVIKFRAKTIDL